MTNGVCKECGATFNPHPDPARCGHDFCESCIPAVQKRWSALMTPPESRTKEQQDLLDALREGE